MLPLRRHPVTGASGRYSLISALLLRPYGFALDPGRHPPLTGAMILCLFLIFTLLVACGRPLTNTEPAFARTLHCDTFGEKRGRLHWIQVQLDAISG